MPNAFVDRFDENGIWRRIHNHAPHHKPAGATARRSGLFLDRDGTIIEASPYLSDPKLVRVIPEAVTAIACANKLGMPVVVVTNQSGIGRGLFDWETYYAVEDAVAAAVTAAGARLDAVYACPHLPEELPPYGRKPDPGMLTAAAAEMNIDLSISWIAGDSASDIEAGYRAGLKGGWLVPTGFGERDAEEASELNDAGFDLVVGETLDGLAEKLKKYNK